MWVNSAQENQFRGGTPADKDNPCFVTHDLRNQFGYLPVWKCPCSVRRERRKCAVIIQKQGARGGMANPLQEWSAHIQLFGDLHFAPFEREAIRGCSTAFELPGLMCEVGGRFS